MAKNTDQKLRRIIDANFNRAKEGLRVCEDICRFILDDKSASRSLKIIRHKLTKAIEALGIRDMIEARRIENDVGRGSIRAEFKRKDMGDVFYANAQRVKESLRVLEELTKLWADAGVSRSLKNMRYQIYAIEKKIVGKI